jgi:hypothetical protein
LWNLGTAGVLILLDRRFKIGHGRLFAGYVALYTVGRFWIEALRIDEANLILGLRLNLWTSVIVFAGAVAYLVVSSRSHPGRETQVHRGDSEPDGSSAGAATDDDVDQAGSTADEPDGETDQPDTKADESDGETDQPDGKAGATDESDERDEPAGNRR